jgi:hypothetical protein
MQGHSDPVFWNNHASRNPNDANGIRNSGLKWIAPKIRPLAAAAAQTPIRFLNAW